MKSFNPSFNQPISAPDGQAQIQYNIPMEGHFQDQLICFIEQELHVEPEAIALAQRQVQFPFQLPVSLWQYGLISLEGVNQIWTWIDSLSTQGTKLSEQCS